MNLKTTISFYFVLALLVVIPGCFEGTIEPVDPEGPIISNITRIISDQDWQTYVVDIDSTDFSIQFDRNVLDSYNLNEGDVIVSTVGYGLLRKIEAVNIEGGYLNITTSQATLMDVIEQGHASIRRTLTISDVQKVEYLEPGVMLRPSIQNKKDIFTWDIKAILYDHDGNPNTTKDQIRIEGEFEFYSDIIFEIDVRFFARLQRVQLGFETGNKADLQLIGEMEFEFEKKIPIATVTFHPIYLQIGVLPVVIVPKFVVEVGVKGGAEGKIIAGIEQSFMYEAGILYTRDADWTTYSDRTTLFDFQPPQASFKASARGFVQPQLEMMMYGVLGAYTNGSLYGEAIVEPFESPWWSLYTGFDLSAGAKAEIFSRELFDVDYTLFEWRHLLAQASTNISTPTVTTTAITEIDYTTATGGGEVTDDGGAPVTARGVAWSTSANPTIGDYKTEDGSGKGTFSSELTDLESGTKYYVRAYATNNSGTGYGNQVSFTTQIDAQLPSVTTANITNITETSATGGGEVTDDGGAPVTARGVAWSTSQNPTISHNKTNDGHGIGAFTSELTGLESATNYFVRAYAENITGIAYGNEVLFITLGADAGSIEGIVRDAVTNNTIENVRINILDSNNLQISTGLTASNGTYNISVPPGYGYTVNYSKDGYLPAQYNNVAVRAFEVTYLEQILYIDENYAGTGDIEGKIISALDGQGVPGINLKLRTGINNVTGTVIAEVNTQTDGSYRFSSIQAGQYTIEASGAGYNTTSFTVICIGGQTISNQNGTISPILAEGEIRIVLTWGLHPRDLDSHLTGPTPDGNRFHVYYRNRNYYYGGVHYVNLDRDDINSYGPETVTIYQQIPGTYRYSVHDYTNRGSTNSMALANSGAQVRVFKGVTLIATYNVPANREGTLWTVFELNGDVITTVNNMSYESNPGAIQKTGRLISTDEDLIRNLPDKK